MRVHPIPPEFNIRPRFTFRRWFPTTDETKRTDKQDPQDKREFYFDEKKGVWIDYTC